MSKLCKARSLLYRRQILQENICWKALDEIYKIYMRLHLSESLGPRPPEPHPHRHDARDLVERFDIEPFSDFSVK